MSFIWRKFEKCSKCAMSTVTDFVAYVIRNVFSRVRKTCPPVEVQLVNCSTRSAVSMCAYNGQRPVKDIKLQKLTNFMP